MVSVGHRPLQEGGGGGRRLVGQLLDVGDAAVVVDGDVAAVPTQTVVRVSLTPAVSAMPTAGADATERLGVEVEQLAGVARS